MSVRSELESRIKAWAESQSPAVPVSWEGVAFNKPLDGVFIQPFILPAQTQNPTVDGNRTRELGILHVNCWSPDGIGMGRVEALADKIVSLFPILPKTGTVSIERTPSKQAPMVADGWRILPVVIYYRREGIVA
jgi:hypothetical protein